MAVKIIPSNAEVQNMDFHGSYEVRKFILGHKTLLWMT